MNFQQNFNARLNKFIVHPVNNYKVGKNLPVNRLAILNNKIELKLKKLDSGYIQSPLKKTFIGRRWCLAEGLKLW